MIVFGLTGKTGAGKSTVASELEKIGFLILDGDKIAREITSVPGPVISELAKAFGDGILFDDGTLNRRELARLAFSDEESTIKLNNITHSAIDDIFRQKISRGEKEGYNYCLIDAAALLESPSKKLCNSIITVHASEQTRLERILKRDNISKEEAVRRMKAQKSDEYYFSMSDFIFNNEVDEFEDSMCRLKKFIDRSQQKMEEKSASQLLAEKLAIKNEHFSVAFEEDDKADEFCEGYIDFLNKAKTERECNNEFLNMAEANGFKEFNPSAKYFAGDKVYVNIHNKALILAVMGRKGVSDGVKIIASHIDSPRLDLKPTPLYEDSEMAYFKTHYYGGLRKYQWGAIPLSLHGVFVKKDGTVVNVSVGEKAGEPKFVITDLLPHLAKEQTTRPLGEGLKGEELNILIGSRPFKDDKGSELVKLNILKILNEKYDIDENDFISAELELVPAFEACEIGFDRSLIGAYGHDDRVCAYPGVQAIFDTELPEHTAVMVLADKEEIGSMGNTGLESRFLSYFIEDLADMEGLKGRHVLSKSQCLSADVNAGFDPNFPSVHDKRNAAFLNHGVVITKYTGARGKSGSNDAHAEFVAKVRNILDSNKVCWQIGELGKVDEGGGGTVALYVSDLGIDTVDLGVPVLSMHAPFEIVAKSDVYSTYRACEAFFKS